MGSPETNHRALVPLDGSPLAEAVLPFVSRLARPLGLEIALLRVVSTVKPEIVQAGTRQIIVDQGERLREGAEAYLRGVAARLVADGFRVTTTVRTGEAAPEIVAGAQECQVDLIGIVVRATEAQAGEGQGEAVAVPRGPSRSRSCRTSCAGRARQTAYAGGRSPVA